MPSAMRTPNGVTRRRRRVTLAWARIEAAARRESDAPTLAASLLRCPRWGRDSRLGAALRRSWREAADRPPVTAVRPDEAIVKARRSSLPELEAIGRNAHAAPVRRPRDVAGEARLDARELGFEPRAIGNPRALRRRPRRKPRCAGALREIGVGLPGGDTLGRAFDPHLPFERRPEKQERGARVGGEVATLAAVVVRVKDEAACIERLEEHGARRRAARGV